MTKTRAFLEYYVKAAAGVPAGQWARDALAELDGLEAAAKAWRAAESLATQRWNLAERALAEAREDIRRRQEEEAAVCPEDVGAVEYIKTLKAQLVTAEARGFERAKEQAAKLIQGGHNPPCYERPMPTGTTVGECGNCARARIIRAMQDGQGTGGSPRGEDEK